MGFRFFGMRMPPVASLRGSKLKVECCHHARRGVEFSWAATFVRLPGWCSAAGKGNGCAHIGIGGEEVALQPRGVVRCGACMRRSGGECGTRLGRVWRLCVRAQMAARAL